MTPEAELRRMEGEPTGDARWSAPALERIEIRCDGDSAAVLGRCREVLRAVLTAPSEPWPDVERWRELLPHWFIGACAPEESPEHGEARIIWERMISAESRRKSAREERWRLSSWIYWFEPGNRSWHWWDASAPDSNLAIIDIAVEDWPFPWGALHWLIRASGGVEVNSPM